METTKNVTQLFVAKNIAKTATANLVIDEVTDIADGEVCVVDPRNNLQLTTAGYPVGFDSFRICQRSGARLIFSDIVKAGTVKRFSISLPANNLATEQIDMVGFNGTSGSIDIFADNIYTVRLYMLEPTISGFMQQKIKEGYYKSGIAPTQYDIANGLTMSLIKNFSREPQRTNRFETVCGAAATATSGGAVTLFYGSNTITVPESAGGAADAGLYNADAGTLVAGDFLRVGSVAVLSAPVYRIVSITGAGTALATIVLDRPFQGSSGAVAAANVGAITSAAGLAADWGLSISGFPSAYDGKFFGMPVTWVTSVDFNDLQTTTVTQLSAASPGTGNYDVLARLEKELQADEYVYRSFIEGAPVDRADVLTTTTYDVVVVEYDGIIESGLGTQVRSPKTLIIVQAGNGGQADVAAIGWLTLLNNIIVTQWVTPGAAALVPTA